MVHVRDTLLEPADAPVAAYRRDAHVVHPDAAVHEVLRDMRERGMQLAVVMDGGTVTGVVSITDIVARVLPRQDTAA
ncbi:hypothetical protein GCM10027411_08940 [Microbacterium aureliae]